MSTSSVLTLDEAVRERSDRPLLSVAISIDYPDKPDALHDVRFDIVPGEILGLVGQSGSGKSSAALAILRLLGHKGALTAGSVRLDGRELLKLAEREMRRIRGSEIGLILQSPLSALNPALRIGAQFDEAWRAHRKGSKAEIATRVREVLRMVSLPEDQEVLRKYPSQLSVGLAQRVLIALAILHRPRLLIADEPTSALDMITQAGILRLFERLRRELNMAILYISHDLLSVAALCDRVAIMKNGGIVECAATADIFSSPAHEYTRALVGSLPKVPLWANDSGGRSTSRGPVTAGPLRWQQGRHQHTEGTGGNSCEC